MSENTIDDDPDRLVAGCRAGERDSQRRLYDACSPRVYRLAARMVGEQDAADVTQQTFLRAFSHLNQYDGNARFETWLYRLAVNESLQHLRRRRRMNQTSSLDYDPPDTSRRSENTEQKELLEQALSRLDPQLRSIFLLRESEELSYREIAEALDIPEGTVGSRLNRARSELKQHLTVLGWTQ
jgi:RNA polymerase sigma-70 factor (ECF subfamily)